MANRDRTLTLLLVRHGETAWNHEGRLQGWQDVPLSQAGHKQVRLLAARLAQAWQSANTTFIPGPPCAFYSSDLSRAWDTARTVAEAAFQTGAALPVQKMHELRERHFGDREGLTADEAIAKWGSAEAARRRETGESYAQVNERMTRGLQAMWDAHAASDAGNVVLVAGHGGSLRLWLCRAVGLGPEAVHRFHLDNTGLSVVTFAGAFLEKSEGRVLLCNDTGHLQAPLPPNNGGF